MKARAGRAADGRDDGVSLHRGETDRHAYQSLLAACLAHDAGAGTDAHLRTFGKTKAAGHHSHRHSRQRHARRLTIGTAATPPACSTPCRAHPAALPNASAPPVTSPAPPQHALRAELRLGQAASLRGPPGQLTQSPDFRRRRSAICRLSVRRRQRARPAAHDGCSAPQKAVNTMGHSNLRQPRCRQLDTANAECGKLLYNIATGR